MNDNAGTIEAAALDLTDLTTELVSAYVSNNRVSVAELPALIATTHAALTGLGPSSTASRPAVEKVTPAQIKKSITHDALISFIDGKPYKTLKRHLNGHGMSFEVYRERYGLPHDYPVIAPEYSARRSEMAKSLGLGRKSAGAETTKAEAEPAPAAEKPKRAGRPRKAKEPAEA